MAKIYESITDLVGKTPLLEIKNYEKRHNLQAKVLVKLEYYNPNQSVKDRIALAMVEDAEKKGLLKPGYTIVGNNQRKYRNWTGSNRSDKRL